MYICSGCEQQFEDNELKYMLIHHSRVSHPAREMFLRRFHSAACLETFLQRLERHSDRYVLTDLTGPEPVTVGPLLPAELRRRAVRQPAGAAGERPR